MGRDSDSGSADIAYPEMGHFYLRNATFQRDELLIDFGFLGFVYSNHRISVSFGS